METYLIDSDVLELPRGSWFTTLPVPVERGELALFDVGGFLIPGRSYLGSDGAGWIQLPGIRVIITGKTPVRIVGAVLPVEAVKQIAPAVEEFPSYLGD